MAKFNDSIFNSVFADDIYEFIRLKQGLGNLYYGPSIILKRFDNFCIDNSFVESAITKEITMAWYEDGIKRGTPGLSQSLCKPPK